VNTKNSQLGRSQRLFLNLGSREKRQLDEEQTMFNFKSISMDTEDMNLQGKARKKNTNTGFPPSLSLHGV
jgi:hypothetical protein